MQLPIETEIAENADTLAVACRAHVDGQSALEVKQRAEGEFLRRLIGELQPMLRESMRSQRILLASDPDGVVALKSDGIFVHVGMADQEDVLEPLQVLNAQPNLLTIVGHIEAELARTDGAAAASATQIVRLSRYALEAAST